MKINSSISILVILVAVLLITNLGNQYLWQDEAQTALISKTILEKGLPYGTDGKNFFSQELGSEYGENYIWKWHTWFPFYVQAFFFWLFGTSNFIARLPFALFGVGSIIYAYLITRKLFNEDKMAFLSVLLLITNVGFLVLSRQARLYSPSIMLSAASLYYFINMKLEIRNRKTFFQFSDFMFIGFTTLLFHTHYFYYATFFISIGLYLLIFERDKIKRFILPTLISGIINLPWVIWFRDLKYNEQYGFNFNKYVIRDFLESYSFSIYKHILGGYSIMVVLFISIFIILFLKVKILKDYKNISLLIIFVLVNLIFLSVFTPTPNYRYLCIMIIPLILLIGWIVYQTHFAHKYIPYTLLAIIIYFSPINDYVYEITHDYDGPLEGISKYLNENANPDDTVLITYGDLPVKWYTNLKTYGGLTGENLPLAKSPDWVIYRKHTVCEKDEAIKDFINKKINLSEYKRIEIPYPDYMFENREDPGMRIFKPKQEDNVIVYRKK